QIINHTDNAAAAEVNFGLHEARGVKTVDISALSGLYRIGFRTYLGDAAGKDRKTTIYGITLK
ncbi:hypothetical protein, partial [Indiicoccus explosivorum]